MRHAEGLYDYLRREVVDAALADGLTSDGDIPAAVAAAVSAKLQDPRVKMRIRQGQPTRTGGVRSQGTGVQGRPGRSRAGR